MICMTDIFKRLKNTQYKSQLADTGYLSLLQGANYIIPLIIVPYLLVKLGPEKYGYIGFATGLSYYFSSIVDFGFNLSATKQVAICYEKCDNNGLNKVFFSTLYCKLILLFVSSALYFSISYIVPQFRIYFVTILCMYPLILGQAFTFSWLFQGLGKIRVISFISLSIKTLTLPLTVLLVKSEDDYNIAALIQSCVFLTTAIVSFVFVLHYKILHFVQVRISHIHNTFKDSFPLFLSSAASTLYSSLFPVILALFATPSMVGRYAASEKIIRAFSSFVYKPVSQAFYPKVAALSITNKAQSLLVISRLKCVLFFVTIIIAFLLIITSDFLSGFLGQGYEGISGLLKIMSVVPMAIAIGGVTGQLGLVAIGDDLSKRFFMTAYWIAAPLSLICVFILSYLLKEIGAAIALVTTEFIVFGLLSYFYKKDRNIKHYDGLNMIGNK